MGPAVIAVTFVFIAFSGGLQPSASGRRGRLRYVRIPGFVTRPRPGEASLAGRLLLLQALVVLAVVMTSSAVAYAGARSDVRRSGPPRSWTVLSPLRWSCRR
jgi:hypothetical protein